MTPNREAVLQKLKASKPELLRQFPLRRLALFGSVARGDATDMSDIDILVDVAPSIGLGFVTLAEQLESILAHEVDLVSSRGIKPMLWNRIEPELIDV